MKKQKRKGRNQEQQPQFVEVVVPLTQSPDEDGLFDDCPLCQDLKRRIEAGEVEAIPFFVDLDADVEGERAMIH